MVVMDGFFDDFGRGHIDGDGRKLAATLSPMDDPRRLYKIWSAVNPRDAQAIIKREIKSQVSQWGMSTDEVNGWADIYWAFWKAIGEIMIMDQTQGKGRVSATPLRRTRSYIAKRESLIRLPVILGRRV
jgi:COP9 signalosome complex subunit 12